MLTRVTVQNVRGLRKVDVNLRPLTVLIGKNDSGKSSFLRALLLLNYAANWDHKDFWRLDPKAKPLVQGWNGSVACNMSSPAGNSGTSNSTAYYVLPPSGPSLDSPGFSDSEGPPAYVDLPYRVPALFDFLLRKDRKRFFDAERMLKEFIPGLDSLDVSTPASDSRRIDLVVDGGLRVAPESVSSGVRLLLFFVALAFHPNAPDLILVEEPENGIHPERLKDIVGILRRITEGAFDGKPKQVIVSTHSPYLVDNLNLEKDALLVFSRAADGSRGVEQADPTRLKKLLGEFLLGELWFNKGESGLVRQTQ